MYKQSENAPVSSGAYWMVITAVGKYKELKKASGLRDRELNAAIGWLAREGKIQFSENESSHKGCLYIELSYYIG